jgi:hypothetical protein
MKVSRASEGKPEGTISNEDKKKFAEANIMFI